jgi:putative SOS response-associated peptidase YedK
VIETCWKTDLLARIATTNGKRLGVGGCSLSSCLRSSLACFNPQKGGTKIPHFTKLPQKGSTPRLMALAGLHDSVKYVDSPADEPPHKTFTILTTTPSKSLAFLHDRMPCILDSEEEILSWLDCREGWTSKVANLLRPYEGDVEW